MMLTLLFSTNIDGGAGKHCCVPGCAWTRPLLSKRSALVEWMTWGDKHGLEQNDLDYMSFMLPDILIVFSVDLNVSNVNSVLGDTKLV